MIFQEFIGYFFPSLDKEGWREAPGWFDPGGGYLIILLKIISLTHRYDLSRKSPSDSLMRL